VLEFRRGSLPLGHLTPPGGCPRSEVSVKLGPAQPDAVGLLIESPSARACQQLFNGRAHSGAWIESYA